MLKALLHTHIKGDPLDNIPYDFKSIIDKAAKEGFKIIAFTCHEKIVMPKQAKPYAKKKGVYLIKGIEATIEGKHVLILNAHEEIEEIETFDDLRLYKSKHPESLIIAPHPFFPGKRSLKENLIKHIDIFDAIEQSYFVTRSRNYNKKAEAIAKKHNKQFIATSDTHVLKYLNSAYVELDISNTLNERSIFNCIKKGKFKNYSKKLSHFQAIKIILNLALVIGRSWYNANNNLTLCETFSKKSSIPQKPLRKELFTRKETKIEF